MVESALIPRRLGTNYIHSDFSYVQFAPVVYTIKLSIELTMAELISKIVRNSHRVDNQNSSSQRAASDGTQLASRNKTKASIPQSHHNYFPGETPKATNNTNTPDGSNDGRMPPSDKQQHDGDGIMKTVTVQMNTINKEEDSTSTTTILPRSPG